MNKEKTLEVTPDIVPAVLLCDAYLTAVEVKRLLVQDQKKKDDPAYVKTADVKSCLDELVSLALVNGRLRGEGVGKSRKPMEYRRMPSYTKSSIG